MRYLPHTQADIQDMLAKIDRPSIKSLFDTIPSSYQLKDRLALDRPLSELELKQELTQRAGQNSFVSFLGAGASPHFVPEAVSQMLLRSEWYTAYTPYQPEASQGTLQAIFEFQTIVANLFGCDIANASMYDGATAFAEALLMSLRLKPQTKKVLVSSAIHPEYREVAQTYLHAAGFEISEISLTQNGLTNDTELQNYLQNKASEYACFAYQTPNFFGQLESQKKLNDMAHQNDLLAVGIHAEPASLGLMQSAGEAGADIVVGEGIGFCGHLSLGAPGVGLFATREKYLRQMPGRLCGQTTDKDGKRGFVLTLSTREQHIRREKATSNICTNHNLMALAMTMSISLYGENGFKNLAKQNLENTSYLREQLKKYQIRTSFDGAHFNETVAEFHSRDKLLDVMHRLQSEHIFAGVDLYRWYKQFDKHLLINTTELHSQKQIDLLVKGLC